MRSAISPRLAIRILLEHRPPSAIRRDARDRLAVLDRLRRPRPRARRASRRPGARPPGARRARRRGRQSPRLTWPTHDAVARREVADRRRGDHAARRLAPRRVPRQPRRGRLARGRSVVCRDVAWRRRLAGASPFASGRRSRTRQPSSRTSSSPSSLRVEALDQRRQRPRRRGARSVASRSASLVRRRPSAQTSSRSGTSDSRRRSSGTAARRRADERGTAAVEQLADALDEPGPLRSRLAARRRRSRTRPSADSARSARRRAPCGRDRRACRGATRCVALSVRGRLGRVLVGAARRLGHDLVDDAEGELLGGGQAHRHGRVLGELGRSRHRMLAAPSGLMTE